MKKPVLPSILQKTQICLHFGSTIRFIIETDERLIQKSIAAASNHPEFARVEFWLIEKEDISRCEQISQRPDQTRCLHLVAAAENTKLGGARESSCFYDSKERIPVGVGFAGKIAQTGQMVVLDNITRAP